MKRGFKIKAKRQNKVWIGWYFLPWKRILKVLDVLCIFQEKDILVLRMQKKTTKGDYLALSLMLSYNDGPKVEFEREISTYVSMHGLQS